MNKEILLVVDVVSNEKDVEKEIIFEAIEAALASATRKKHGGEIDARVSIDRETGDYQSFRRWEVVEESEEEEFNLEHQILLEDARNQNPEIEVGAFIEEPMDSIAFGQIGRASCRERV